MKILYYNKNKLKQLRRPGLAASYVLQPGNGAGLLFSKKKMIKEVNR